MKSVKVIFCVIFCLLLAVTASIVHGYAAETGHPEVKAPKEESAYQKEARRIKEIFQEIKTGNSSLKRSPEWLKEAYSGLHIRDLRSIPKESFKDFRQSLYNSNVYIIVHPGYYAFFHEKH